MNSSQTDSWSPYSQHRTTVESSTMQVPLCVLMLVCSAHFRFSSHGGGEKGILNSSQVKGEKRSMPSKGKTSTIHYKQYSI
jgi:hypothetical protein